MKGNHGSDEGSDYLLPHTVAIALKHPEASWYDPVKQRSTAQLNRFTWSGFSSRSKMTTSQPSRCTCSPGQRYKHECLKVCFSHN